MGAWHFSPGTLNASVGRTLLARECGKTLLTLNTANSEAQRLYQRLGWVRVGVIPGYSLLPRGGGLCDATVYYRNLGD